MDYLVSYNVKFVFEDDEVEDGELLAERLGDTMYEWLASGGRPHPDNIKVEKL